MGIMGAMTTLGPSVSVIAAGVLLSFFHWHILLWVFTALSLLCFLCGLFLLGSIAELSHPRLDIPSTVLVSIALLGILYGISGLFSVHPVSALLSMGTGTLLLCFFFVRQKKLSDPLIDIKPLSVTPFSIGVVLNMLSLIVIFAMNIVMPLFLQGALGASALHASLALFPAILLSCIVAPVAGKVYDRYGAKLLLPCGFALIGLASVTLAHTGGTASFMLFALLYIPVICGSALLIGPVQSFALSYLTPQLNPHGVTVMSTGFQIAGCLGSSLFSGVYSSASSSVAGFSLSCLLAALLSVFGFILSLFLQRSAKKCDARLIASARRSIQILQDPE